VAHNIFELPVGSKVDCKPEILQFIVKTSGSGSVTSSGSNKATSYTTGIDTIPPHHQVKIRFFSIESDKDGLPDFPTNDDALIHYILGKFQYSIHNRYFSRNFLVPLSFDGVKREIESSPCEDYDKGRKLLHRQEWL